jgi:uncharacterized integral membrane protein (TIGR00698 family)
MGARGLRAGMFLRGQGSLAILVLLGAQLSVGEIVTGGLASLPVMLGTFAAVLATAYALGRALGLDRDVRRLIGIGTAICGGSAIAALSSVVEVDASDVAYALATIFFFNIVAVLAFPPLGRLMHLDQHAFGVWAGTAINDTSSVVAAGFSYGRLAGNAAVIVKLTRTLLIVPTVGFYAVRRMLGATSGTRDVDWLAIFPWFVLWFLVAAALNSSGVIPAAAHEPLQRTALFTIALALAGVGASADVTKIRAAGFRPLLLGGALWLTISLASLGFARLFGVL